MQIIPRNEAKRLGLTKYYTGKPCPKGHVAERRVGNGACLECASIISKKWKEMNGEYVKARLRAYREKHRAELLASARIADKERSAEKKAYLRERYQKDPSYRLRVIMRAMLRRAAMGISGKRTHEALGYSHQELREHIERQFEKGMTWQNHGVWHIDHITPIKWFSENGIDDPAQINCLSNLRPVWASENIRKGDKRTTLL